MSTAHIVALSADISVPFQTVITSKKLLCNNRPLLKSRKNPCGRYSHFYDFNERFHIEKKPKDGI